MTFPSESSGSLRVPAHQRFAAAVQIGRPYLYYSKPRVEAIPDDFTD